MTPQMQKYQARIEATLDRYLNDADIPDRLRDSMRYSTLSGGKRVRALLVYAAGLTTNARIESLDTIAAAIELIHAYSLIHDDLPAMDDDDLRRGQPTNHIKFDEATAILAGDALQTLGFELILSNESQLNDLQSRQITLELAKASGAIGMVGGQMLDIQATDNSLSLDELENVHRRKTGALIKASVVCGALAGETNDSGHITALSDYATNIGLAFQVVDDVLDIEGSTDVLGKPSGSDQELGKSTYPALLGLDESKQLAKKLYQQAIDCISAIGDNTQHTQASNADNSTDTSRMLRDIAELIIKRTH